MLQEAGRSALEAARRLAERDEQDHEQNKSKHGSRYRQPAPVRQRLTAKLAEEKKGKVEDHDGMQLQMMPN